MLRNRLGRCAYLVFAFSACAPELQQQSGTTAPTPLLQASRDAAADAPCDPSRDRAAIRAMAGEFKVKFTFEETEALTPGYKLEKPYETDATEVVELLEDSERHVVLQHVLVFGRKDGTASAMKHWRQDWTYEAAALLEFRGQHHFEQRQLAPEPTHCTWTQAVYEVDDGPRYASYGRWVYKGDAASWTSQETWRPLPRREYTHRSDYDVLVGTNRHVVTPNGWVHEQDNQKLVLADGRRLARERGVNRYERTSLPSAAVARAYLRDTGEFWRGVRGAWDAALSAVSGHAVVANELDGKPRHERFFALAEASKSATQPVSDSVQALVQRCVQPSSAPAGSTLARGEP
ncbi:MAG: DUF6607 family protein [Polyangiales bacterium]